MLYDICGYYIRNIVFYILYDKSKLSACFHYYFDNCQNRINLLKVFVYIRK